jgi:hypothetical protein
MLSIYRYIILAIPFVIIFFFVKNKKKFTIIYFSFYALLVFAELAFLFYIYLTEIKK